MPYAAYNTIESAFIYRVLRMVTDYLLFTLNFLSLKVALLPKMLAVPQSKRNFGFYCKQQIVCALRRTL